MKVVHLKLENAPTFGVVQAITDPLRLAKSTGMKFTQPRDVSGHNRHSA